jgi:hypothetical protein
LRRVLLFSKPSPICQSQYIGSHIRLCAWTQRIRHGAMGVSFKMRKRREIGKNHAKREQRRRAARLRQSYPYSALHGYSREALRPRTPPLRGLTHDLKLITGQRLLRFSILKETPTVPRKAREAILRLWDTASRQGAGSRRGLCQGVSGRRHCRLMKIAHLRCTSMCASLLGISGALHLDVFDQPARQAFSSDLRMTNACSSVSNDH